MVHRDEYRQMVLAGTVSFPATFPQVGKLTLKNEKLPSCEEQVVAFLVVTENPSARVTLVRRVLAKSVRAVFLPRDPRHVNYGDGEWLLGDEVLPALQCLFQKCEALHGIAFIPESEPSMLNVSVGMTAAESAQYYPPLPNDPAHNHYNAWPATTSGSVLGSHSAAVHGEVGSCAEVCLTTHLGSCATEIDLCRALWSCHTSDDCVEMEAQFEEQSLSKSLSQSRGMPNGLASSHTNSFPLH